MLLQISLLDGKRSMNINIFLKQFKMDNPSIAQLISSGAYREIGQEKLTGLLKFLPESDEVQYLARGLRVVLFLFPTVRFK